MVNLKRERLGNSFDSDKKIAAVCLLDMYGRVKPALPQIRSHRKVQDLVGRVAPLTHTQVTKPNPQ